MDHLLLVLGGMVVVLGVLALLWGATALVGLAFTWRPPATQPRGSMRTGAGRGAPAGPPPHHRVAITAAVAALTGGRGRIVRVTAAPMRAPAWAGQGRADHAGSHRVRWDWAVPGPPHRDPDAPPHSKRPE